jgi:preprotein translocase subunit SecB
MHQRAYLACQPPLRQLAKLLFLQATRALQTTVASGVMPAVLFIPLRVNALYFNQSNNRAL